MIKIIKEDSLYSHNEEYDGEVYFKVIFYEEEYYLHMSKTYEKHYGVKVIKYDLAEYDNDRYMTTIYDRIFKEENIKKAYNSYYRMCYKYQLEIEKYYQ